MVFKINCTCKDKMEDREWRTRQGKRHGKEEDTLHSANKNNKTGGKKAKIRIKTTENN